MGTGLGVGRGTGPALRRGVGTLRITSAPPSSPPPSRRGQGAIALVTAAALYTSGCLSHEYRLPDAELTRLAATPPEARGDRLRVVQNLGLRRAPALDPTAPPPVMASGSEPWNEDPWYHPDVYPHGHVHVSGCGHVIIPVGGGGHGRRYGRGGGSYPGGLGPVKAPPVGNRASVVGTGGGTPARPIGTWRGPGRPAPAPSSGGTGGSGGGGLSLPSGGGGKDDLIVYAVVGIAVASLAAVGLAATEGMRFDGDIAAAPGQLVYLRDASGAERAVPLAQLTSADLAGVERAVLRDDEGYGLLRLGRAPLDRQGFAFKVDVGGAQSSLNRDLLSGLASHIQLGYFPHHRLGLLGGVSLAVGQGQPARRFARHALNFETQLFPLSWRRAHLGVAGHAGSSLLRHQSGDVDGAPTFGAGAIFEIALTTRLALHARADWSASRTAPGTWSPTRSLSAGIAIY